MIPEIIIGHRYYIECSYNIGSIIEITSIDYINCVNPTETEVVYYGFDCSVGIWKKFNKSHVTYVEEVFIDCDLGI